MPEENQQERTEVNFSMRMPADLHQWLTEKASKNYRSKVSEILFLMEKARAEELSTEIKV